MHAGSVIIVTYNSEENIASCLKALAGETEWQVILIDNASVDSTIQRARESGVDVRIVSNPANVGFAAALNQGAKMAAGKVLLVLNPDVIVTAGSLSRLAETLSQDGVGGATGMLVAVDGSPALGFNVRRFPTLGRMLAEVLLLNRLWKENPLNRQYRCLDLDHGSLQEIEQPAGACLAVKRNVWESLGGFNQAAWVGAKPCAPIPMFCGVMVCMAAAVRPRTKATRSDRLSVNFGVVEESLRIFRTALQQ